MNNILNNIIKIEILKMYLNNVYIFIKINNLINLILKLEIILLKNIKTLIKNIFNNVLDK